MDKDVESYLWRTAYRMAEMTWSPENFFELLAEHRRELEAQPSEYERGRKAGWEQGWNAAHDRKAEQ